MPDSSLAGVADWSTIASLATAGGTLVLAIATFGSTRSANRAARVSEEALLVGLRPVLFNARPDDPAAEGAASSTTTGCGCATGSPRCRKPTADPLHGDAAAQRRTGHRGAARLVPAPEIARSEVPHRPVEEFRRSHRDLYVPAGDINFWQAAVRDPEDPLYEPLKAAIARGEGLSVDLLYGDHEGGQRTITRFYLAPRDVRRRRRTLDVDVRGRAPLEPRSRRSALRPASLTARVAERGRRR